MTPKSRRWIRIRTHSGEYYSICLFRTARATRKSWNRMFLWSGPETVETLLGTARSFPCSFFLFCICCTSPSSPRNYKLYLFHRVFHRSPQASSRRGLGARWMHTRRTDARIVFVPNRFSFFLWISCEISVAPASWFWLAANAEEIYNSKYAPVHFLLSLLHRACVYHAFPSTSAVRSFGKGHEHGHHISIPIFKRPKALFSSVYTLFHRENNWDGFTVPPCSMCGTILSYVRTEMVNFTFCFGDSEWRIE